MKETQTIEISEVLVELIKNGYDWGFRTKQFEIEPTTVEVEIIPSANT